MHIDLPKSYHFIDNLNIKNIEKLNKKVALIYRNYNKKPNDKEIRKFKNYCKRYNKKFFVSNYFDIVKKFNLDGFYIPSFNEKLIYSLTAKKLNLTIIGSAHNLKEIRVKERQGAKLIFLSPLFKSKNSNKSLGLYKYNYLSHLTKLPTIALGGITKTNFKLLKLLKTYGFASISFFKENINYGQ